VTVVDNEDALREATERAERAEQEFPALSTTTSANTSRKRRMQSQTEMCFM
jgi:hypothetical protein